MTDTSPQHSRCRIVTFNVNGVRTLTGYAPWNALRSFKAVLDHLDADIVCFQETKITRDKLAADIAVVEGYDSYLAFCRSRSGYSGVATYVRQASPWLPVAAEEGLNGLWSTTTATTVIGHYIDPNTVGLDAAALRELDSEGRCVVTDHQAFVLFNCYFPNAGSDEERFDFKMNFNRTLQARCDALLRAGRHVVIAGDVNCCHYEIDTSDPGRMLKQSGLSTFMARPDRQWLHAFLSDGGGPFVDLFRRFHPTQPRAFTCWDTRTNARETNYGTRIDYILCDEALVASAEQKNDMRPGFWDCRIMREVLGSDHCPVVADAAFDASDIIPPKAPPPLCSRWMPEFSGKQQTLKAFMTCRPQPIPTSSADGQSPPVGSEVHDKPHATPATASVPPPLPLQHTSSSRPPPPKRTRLGSANLTGQRSIAQFFGKTLSTNPSSSSPPPPPLPPSSQPLGGSSTSDDCEETQLESVASDEDLTPAEIDAVLTAEAQFQSTPPPPNHQQAEAKRQWSNMISSAPRLPLCRHGEPCIILTVTKGGPNQGRKFFICARPIGDKSDRTTRCDFFEWTTRRSTDSPSTAPNRHVPQT